MKLSPIYNFCACIVSLLIMLTSCTSEDGVGNGYLQVERVVAHQTANVVVTRAVDNDFYICVTNSQGQKVKEFAPGDEAAKQKVELAVGEYTLEAYTANAQTPYAADDKGQPKYHQTQKFTIRAAHVTTVDCQVPMTNCVWELKELEGAGTWVKDYTFTVAIGSRSFAMKVGDVVCFDPGEAQYRLTLKNADDEEFTQSGTLQAEANKHYQVRYTVAPQQQPTVRITPKND
ncbi:MAG: DUF4493 domain-containing protein [Bacteroidaceae bacterium]|nr:DUF4493 domain-containing protein [Bacteroidaceae bacterium]